MPSPLYIPEPVRTAITSHIDSAIEQAISGYLSGNEDEDTLTGQLGGSLKIGKQVVDANGWTWSVTLRSCIRIAITSPDWKRPSGPRRITKAEIHNHRMHADPEEILGVGRGASAKQISAARNKLALTYHPDKFAFHDDLLQELLKRRMQETNQAYSSVKRK